MFIFGLNDILKEAEEIFFVLNKFISMMSAPEELPLDPFPSRVYNQEISLKLSLIIYMIFGDGGKIIIWVRGDQARRLG
jgi:hypothetical protein